MKKSTIVFFGSDDFAAAHLDALARSGFPVTACVTQPDRPKGRGYRDISSPVKDAALKAGVPILQPESFGSQVIDQLKSYQADVFVVIAFGRILPQAVLDIPTMMPVNVHSSLLPKYRGAAPINWAVINGDKETGITIIRMNARMDAGDIIGQAVMAIAPEDNAATLRERMMNSVGPELLMKTLEEIAAGRVIARPQDESNVTYAPKLTKDLGKIDWAKSAEEIHNLVRGLQPWPVAYTTIHGKRLKIFQSDVVEISGGHKAGQVADIFKDAFVVGTGQNGLLVNVVQPESSRRMCVEEFLAGRRMRTGDVLGE